MGQGFGVKSLSYDLSWAHKSLPVRWPFEKAVLSAGFSQHCLGVARLRGTGCQDAWLSRLGAVCFSTQELKLDPPVSLLNPKP